MTETKLNPNAQKWVAALRSGDYKQGRKMLHTVEDEMCCLGVACQLAIADGVTLAVGEREEVGDLDRTAYTYNGEVHYPPEEVRAWLGLHDSHGRFYGNRVAEDVDYTSLADANDSGCSFEEIADLIEGHADMLFTKPAEVCA